MITKHKDFYYKIKRFFKVIVSTIIFECINGTQ